MERCWDFQKGNSWEHDSWSPPGDEQLRKEGQETKKGFETKENFREMTTEGWLEMRWTQKKEQSRERQ